MNVQQTDRKHAYPGAMRHAMVVDDHPLFAEALELTLRSVADGMTVTVASSLQEALAAPAPDLVLLDLNLPDVSGFDGLIRLRRTFGATPVVVVSSMTDPKVVAGALEAGASGYVPKHSPRAVFRAALDAVTSGTTFVPEGFELPAADERTDRPIARLDSLTAQQARILELICDGKLNKQIAFELSIAEATVKAHVTAIMRKLGVQNRTQAVLVAQRARFDTVLPGRA